jgi:hypothetical protein
LVRAKKFIARNLDCFRNLEQFLGNWPIPLSEQCLSFS